MESGKKEASYLVFVGFVLLFLVFMVLNPGSKNTSNAIIGSSTLGENPSIITLMVLFVILIVVLAVVFIIFKKIKSKRKSNANPPKPSDSQSKMSDNKVETELEEKKDSRTELAENDINELFSSGGTEEKEQPKPAEMPKKEPMQNTIQQKPTEKKVMTNLQDLKNKVKGMLSQSFTKDQIIGNLKSQGISSDQISKVIIEVNIDNLRE